MNHELIDTWWDVNFSNSSSTQPLAAELIDTWWDVNLLGIHWDWLETLN